MGELSTPVSVIEIGTAPGWKCSSAWVRGPLWDGFWMLSALWLAPIVLLLVHGDSNPESSPLDLLYFGLTALFWIGHRFSSDPQAQSEISALFFNGRPRFCCKTAQFYKKL